MSKKSTTIHLFGGSAFTVGLIFVTLKLAGVIAWPWWIVTLPFWGGLALVFGLLAAAVVIAAVGWTLILTLGLISAGLSKLKAYPKNRDRRS